MIPSELPLGQELTSTLREWAVIWHKLYVVSSPRGLMLFPGELSWALCRALWMVQNRTVKWGLSGAQRVLLAGVGSQD